MLALPALTFGTAVLAQGVGLRLPGATEGAYSATTTASLATAWPAWSPTRTLAAMDAPLGADYRIASGGMDASWLPQFSVGLQQRARQAGGPLPGLRTNGAGGGGTDLVIGATRTFLDQSLLLHGALRASQHSQAGLPGFEGYGTGRDSRALQSELGVAWLLRRDLAIGAEYRFRSGGSALALGDGPRDDDGRDIYVSWMPRRDLSLSFGWTDQGRSGGIGITPRRSLTGFYVAGQVAF